MGIFLGQRVSGDRVHGIAQGIEAADFYRRLTITLHECSVMKHVFFTGRTQEMNKLDDNVSLSVPTSPKVMET